MIAVFLTVVPRGPATAAKQQLMLATQVKGKVSRFQARQTRRELRGDRRIHLPEPFAFRPIDQALLQVFEVLPDNREIHLTERNP